MCSAAEANTFCGRHRFSLGINRKNRAARFPLREREKPQPPNPAPDCGLKSDFIKICFKEKGLDQQFTDQLDFKINTQFKKCKSWKFWLIELKMQTFPSHKNLIKKLRITYTSKFKLNQFGYAVWLIENYQI